MEKCLILLNLKMFMVPLKPYLDSCPGSEEKSVETLTPPCRPAFPPQPTPVPFPLSPANVREGYPPLNHPLCRMLRPARMTSSTSRSCEAMTGAECRIWRFTMVLS